MMAITGVNGYNGVYESTYAASKKEAAKKEETKETAAAQKSAETAKAKSASEYLSKLQKQVKGMELKEGTGFAKPKGNINHCITVDPKLLEKMQNDPQVEKEYIQRLKDIERASNYVTNYFRAKGDIVYHNDQWYIDENGKYSHFAQIVIKDRLNERLRKEAQENAKKQIEKTRENARKKAEQLAEKLEEKISNAKDGVIYLHDTDIPTIMEAAREDDEDRGALKQQAEGALKQQAEVGANVDFRI